MRRISSGIASRRRLRSHIVGISDLAERIYIENLYERIASPSRDPVINRLVFTLNNMIERLEKDVRKQSYFVTDASHELRTPIAIIKGYADLMDRWGKNNPKVMQESINAIKTEATRINSLILSLLALTRGDNILENRELAAKVSLNETCMDTVRDFKLINKKTVINVINESEETVIASYEMLMQLIRLFLDNSVKYAKNEEDEIQLVISGDENASYLSIKDMGIGISEEDLPFVFERFYRADKSRNSKIPGFGLGLALADMIVRAQNASITVHSELDMGTEFIISFFKRNKELQ